ncbi:putative MmcQ-like protein [Ketogulonicigenium robustum]|uniref:Putative MmcQ-like protein n=1 Tax=Ketogulonicigenium robustum TaxID=92947 RepID=A0A1W6NZ08_9RHOB|nr:MmcQ/YjbR family DNA-binding protein [Ketogulonicigenium robustum]ARO14472.1 putative MmcQ-like protein [Ketogulonicigenium robustum]
MRDQDIHAIASEHAESLLASVRTTPFGPDAVVYKLRDKMFCLIGAVDGRPAVTLKCDPERSHFLREHLPSIRTGYHMNKRHWISVLAGPDIDDDLLRDLISDAYALVRDSLPKAQRIGLG